MPCQGRLEAVFPHLLVFCCPLVAGGAFSVGASRSGFAASSSHVYRGVDAEMSAFVLLRGVGTYTNASLEGRC